MLVALLGYIGEIEVIGETLLRRTNFVQMVSISWTIILLRIEDGINIQAFIDVG